MKKTIFALFLIHAIVIISCNQKMTGGRVWTRDAKDSIPYLTAKKNIDLYQENIKKDPTKAVLAINLRSDIVRDIINLGHSIRIFPAFFSETRDSTILIVEVYNKRSGSTFYNMAHFFSPKDTLSPDMRSRAVLCPEPPLCSVDYESR